MLYPQDFSGPLAGRRPPEHHLPRARAKRPEREALPGQRAEVSGPAVAGVPFLRRASFCTRMPVADSARMAAVAERCAGRARSYGVRGLLAASVHVSVWERPQLRLALSEGPQL
eukprot:6813352-Pyramimonas_sp.AAC.1